MLNDEILQSLLSNVIMPEFDELAEEYTGDTGLGVEFKEGDGGKESTMAMIYQTRKQDQYRRYLIELESKNNKYEPHHYNVEVKYQFPNNPEWIYYTEFPRIDFDKEKERDIQSGNGFVISSPKATIKKDVNNDDGIFSRKFGQRLGDASPYIDRYRCNCGTIRSKSNNGKWCNKCQSYCRRVDDNFNMFGWIEIVKEYALIHPDLFRALDLFFGTSKFSKDKKKKRGSVLCHILEFDKEIDQDGNVAGNKYKANEPFYGIGMIEFHERFDEIMEYYKNKHKNNPNKMDIYNDIMKDRDLVFVHNLPVFTTILRPVDITDNNMYYEKTNGYYRMMVRLAQFVNKNKRKMDRSVKLKNGELYKLQMKYMELYEEIFNILSGKKGTLRSMVAGRCNFTSRCVIKQNPDLRIDQIELPYIELVITQEQNIINILHRTFNITYQEAWNKWFKGIINVDDTIKKILEDLIHNSCNGEGLPVLINRNPTLHKGNIGQMYVVGINYNFTMSVPLQILRLFAADFDGDVLNILHIISMQFYERAKEIFNPRFTAYISCTDGLTNRDVLVQRDTLINANTLNDLTYPLYTEAELEHIEMLKRKAKDIMY